MKRRPKGACDRARAWAALAPDGELSEIEQKLLDAHLMRCQDCADFATSAAGVAEALRRERLVPLSYPVTLAFRRSAAFGRIRAAGAAAAVALMAIGIASRGPLPAEERQSSPLRVTNFSNNAELEVAQILRAEKRSNGALRSRPERQGTNRL